MPSLDLNILCRPVRIAFIVQPNNRKHLADSLSANTHLWGGLYNPIIPFWKKLPKDFDSISGMRSAKAVFDGYLEYFKPDVLVELKEGMLDDEIRRRFRVYGFEDLFTGSDASIGVGMQQVYVHLYKTHFRYQQRVASSFLRNWSESENFLHGAFFVDEHGAELRRSYEAVFQPNEKPAPLNKALESQLDQVGDPLSLTTYGIDSFRRRFQLAPPAFYIQEEFLGRQH